MPIVTLVRHGQASFGAANYDALSPLGHQQSRWLGEYFRDRGLRFAACASGTLARQRETLDGVLAGMVGNVEGAIPRTTDAGFDEYFGDPILEAHLRARGDTLDPKPGQKAYFRRLREALLAWIAGELDGHVPETWAHFGARAWGSLRAVCEPLGRDDRALIVTSGGVISRLVADALEASGPAAIEINLQTRNASITELIVARSAVRVVSYNMAPHLERADRESLITYA